MSSLGVYLSEKLDFLLSGKSKSSLERLSGAQPVHSLGSGGGISRLRGCGTQGHGSVMALEVLD